MILPLTQALRHGIFLSLNSLLIEDFYSRHRNKTSPGYHNSVHLGSPHSHIQTGKTDSRPDATEILLAGQATGKTWHTKRDSAESFALPITSVVRALLLLPLVLTAVVDSKYRCHDCRESCRDDPSPVELLVRILLILQHRSVMVLRVLLQACYLLE